MSRVRTLSLCTQGSLLGVLLLVMPASRSARAADITSYAVERIIHFTQTSAGDAVLAPKNPYVFEASVQGVTSNLITAASLQSPQGLGATLAPDGDQFKFKQKAGLQSTLDASYGDGTYQLTISTVHDGTKTVPLTLQGDTYPNAPHFANFAGLQNPDPGLYQVVTWDAFIGGTTVDFIQLRIEDSQGHKLFESADLGKRGALDGLATSVIVPRNTFLPGVTNDLTLAFGKVVTVDTTNYPGAVGRALYVKRTKVSVKTSSNPTVADVKTFALLKMKRFRQRDAGAPVLDAVNGFEFESKVEASSSNSLISATLLTPNRKSISLPPTPDHKRFEFADEFSAMDQFDLNYPIGAFTFSFTTTNQGVKVASLNLPAANYPDPPPHIINFDAAQSFQTTNAFTLSWNPFVSGNSSDFIQLRIEDSAGTKIFETSDFGKTEALKGTATSATIPSATLLSGKTYLATLMFFKIDALDTLVYPGALGFAGYAAKTKFPITTSGAITAPRLNTFQFLTNGAFRVAGTGLSGHRYGFQASTNLVSWRDLGAADAPNGQFEFIDATASTARFRFYRVILQQ